MKKEVKVSLCISENDSYVELWKNINPKMGEAEYYGRYTYQDQGTWYYVSDALGYCELFFPVSKEIVFLCCTKDGKEYCRYSNADTNPLPKFETVVKAEWEKAKKKLAVLTELNHAQEFWLSSVRENEDRFKQWLLSFKDPEKYAKEIKTMYGYDDNWLYACPEEICSETVTYAAPMDFDARCDFPQMKLHRKSSCKPIPGTTFTYLGTRYCFSRIAFRHKVCGATWMEYHCTKETPEWNEMYHHTESYGVFGYDFNAAAEGPMYSERTAVSLVKDALKLSMPADFGYYVVTEKQGYQTLGRYTVHDLAEHILNRNYRKTNVGDLTVQLVNTCKMVGSNAWIRHGNEVICIANKINAETLKKLYPDIPAWAWLQAIHAAK